MHSCTHPQGSWGDWVRKAPVETMKLGVKGEDMPK